MQCSAMQYIVDLLSNVIVMQLQFNTMQVGPPPRASSDWLSLPRLLRASPAEWVRTPELWTMEALLDAYAVRTFTVVDQACSKPSSTQ
jgi:hypothetical protein